MSWKELLTSFDGRIRRGQFWMGAIGLSVGLGILYLIVFMAFGTRVPPDPTAPPMGYGYQMNYTFGLLGSVLLFAIAVVNVWCGLALSIKRWHDRDKSGWWVLINFVPLIGGIWAFVETGCLRGTVGPNRFGEDPVGQ
jgi:uncharacterized membrane protein YhaH (DUF805 family)